MLRFLVLLRALRRDIAVLLFAMLRRDTPRAVKFLFPLTLLYLMSPIDIVPDTIPLLGAVDDMVILPAAELLVRMLPPEARAEGERRVARYGTLVLIVASIVLILWLVLLVWALSKVFA